MKKIVLAAMVLGTSVSMFSACMSSEVDTNNTNSDMTQEQERVEYIGVISNAEVSFGQRGTHKLTLDSGKEIMLQSKDMNLNLYLDQEVEVRGFRVENGETELVEVLSILESDGMEEEEPVEWKITSFDELGLAIGYSTMFNIREQAGGEVIRFTPRDEEAPEVSVILAFETKNTSQDLDEYVKAKFPGESFDNVFLGEYDGLRSMSEDGNLLRFYVKEGDAVFAFTYEGEDGDEEYKKSFFQMMDSISFQELDTEETEQEEELPEELIKAGEEEVTPASTSSRTESSVSTSNEVKSSTESETEKTTPEKEEVKSMDSTSPKSEETSLMFDTEEKSTQESTTVNSSSSSSSSSSTSASSTSTSSSDVVKWFKANAAGMLPSDATPQITSLELSGDKHIYVNYMDGDVKKRVLFAYTKSAGTYVTDTVGVFVEGEERDWDMVDGTNPVATEAKTVYSVSDSGLEETATVKEGYRLFDSSSRGYSIQYPANWYYAGTSSNTMGFSNEPVEEGNVAVSMEVKSSSLNSMDGSSTSVGGKSGKVSYSTDEDGNAVVTVSVEGEDGKVYSLSGGAEDEAMLKGMLETLETK